MCEVRIEQGAIGDFTVKYGDYHGGIGLDVHIDTKDPDILGDISIAPYSKHTYCVNAENSSGEFWIEGNLARIIEQDGKTCKVEVLSGKKGNFILNFKNFEVQYQLPIEIRSL